MRRVDAQRRTVNCLHDRVSAVMGQALMLAARGGGRCVVTASDSAARLCAGTCWLATRSHVRAPRRCMCGESRRRGGSIVVVRRGATRRVAIASSCPCTRGRRGCPARRSALGDRSPGAGGDEAAGRSATGRARATVFVVQAARGGPWRQFAAPRRRRRGWAWIERQGAIPPDARRGSARSWVVLAASGGEHGAGGPAISRDRSHGVYGTIGRYDLR